MCLLCPLWLPHYSTPGDILFFFLMDAATDIGRASKKENSHFLDCLMLHVVCWFKSQEIFWNKKCLKWTVNSRPPCWRNQEIYAVLAEEDGITKYPLAQCSPKGIWWMVVLDIYTVCFTKQQFRLFKFRDPYFVYSWWRAGEALFSLWKRILFQGTDFS